MTARRMSGVKIITGVDLGRPSGDATVEAVIEVGKSGWTVLEIRTRPATREDAAIDRRQLER